MKNIIETLNKRITNLQEQKATAEFKLKEMEFESNANWKQKEIQTISARLNELSQFKFMIKYKEIDKYIDERLANLREQEITESAKIKDLKFESNIEFKQQQVKVIKCRINELSQFKFHLEYDYKCEKFIADMHKIEKKNNG